MHLLIAFCKSHQIISFARFKLIEPVVEHLSEKETEATEGIILLVMSSLSNPAN